MPLKTIVESLDDVEEAYRGLYEEDGDKFVLQIEGVDSHPDVAKLKNAYASEKTKRQAQGKELAAAKKRAEEAEALADGLPDDFDLDTWKKAKAGGGDDEARVALRKKFETEIADAKAETEKLRESLRRSAIDRGLDEALGPVGITDPVFLKASRMMLAERVKLDDDGNAFVDTDMGPLDLKSFAKQFASGEGKSFVTPPKGGGAGGSDGAGGKASKTIRPEDLEAMTPREKAKFFRDNPETVVAA